jgi:hypothetical protein
LIPSPVHAVRMKLARMMENKKNVHIRGEYLEKK